MPYGLIEHKRYVIGQLGPSPTAGAEHTQGRPGLEVRPL
jgi:hypothetical protein